MKQLLLITFLLFFTFSFAQRHNGSSSVFDGNQQPKTLAAISCSPNPFQDKTRINFRSSINQPVEFTVKNLLGKTVYLEEINCKSGFNTIHFNRNNIAKGMYIYSLQTATEIVSKRLVIR